MKFKTAKSALAVLALLSASAQVSANTHFNFTFNAGNDGIGSGYVDASQNANGTYTAHGGLLTVFSSSANASIIGTYSLATAEGYPAHSSHNRFIFDDLLLPTADPVIDVHGLLFTNAGGTQINFFSTDGVTSGAYALMVSNNTTYIVNPTGAANTTFQLEVPEPLSFALLGIGFSALSLNRRKKAAA